jgi:hypothetical protein
MSGVWYLVFAILAVVALGLLFARLYREIFFFEGIRLGGRLHAMLYDRWADSYDADKRKSQKDDARTLVEPLVERLESDAANSPTRSSSTRRREPDDCRRLFWLTRVSPVVSSDSTSRSTCSERPRISSSPSQVDRYCCTRRRHRSPFLTGPSTR